MILAPECYLRGEPEPPFYAGPPPRGAAEALAIVEGENDVLRARIRADAAIRDACAASAPTQ